MTLVRQHTPDVPAMITSLLREREPMFAISALTRRVVACAVGVASLTGFVVRPGATAIARRIVPHPSSVNDRTTPVANAMHKTVSGALARRIACTSSVTAVTPCPVSATAYPRRVLLKTNLTVKNKIRTEPNSYIISCTISGAVSWCGFADPYGNFQSTTSLPVAANSSAPLTVYYNTGTSAGAGTVVVNVDDGLGGVTATTNLSVVAAPTSPPLHLPRVSPTYQSREVDAAAATTSLAFAVVDQGTDTATYSYQVSCAGAAITGSCAPASGTVALTPNVPSTIAVSVPTGGAIGASGTVRLTTWRSASPSIRDSGTVAILVAQRAPGLVLASPNAGPAFERSLCFTASVGGGASYECGGLRLAGALPDVRTRNKSRAPVLLYQSQHAKPQAIVAADLTLPNDGQIPQGISAQLRDAGGNVLASGSWSPSDWAAGSTRRIALAFDASATPTGVYQVTFDVTRTYAGTSAHDVATGDLTVVNRTASPYGAGWWIAGVEQLVLLADGSRLWIDGDGSTRRYVAAGTNVWAAPSLDRPDTLRFDGTYYTRQLRHGLRVLFDANGRHVMTITRLQDTTTFAYDPASGGVATITVPRVAFGRSYTFAYANGAAGLRLQSVTAPPGGGSGSPSRLTTLAYDGSGLALRIQPPGDSAVTFQYASAGTGLIVSRTDGRGTVTTFTYDANRLLTGASTPLDSGGPIAVAITPLEKRGLSGTQALSAERVYTLLDGPRTDVSDTTQFWADVLGAVRRVRDALGNETQVTRGDVRWPALPTRVQTPDGRVVGATYDAAGRLAATTDSSRYDPARAKYATSTYQWDPAFDFVTLAQGPEGDLVRSAFDPANGNRLWQEDGRGSMSRVAFEYATSGAASGLLTAVVHAGTGARDSAAYDAVGNLARSVSAIGNPTEYFTDAAGRDTLVRFPVDAAGTLSQVLTVRSLSGRDSVVRSFAGSDTSDVRMTYDAAGSVATVVKRSLPDRNAIGPLTQTFTYDRAGRKLAETLVGFNTTTWTYDAAGNMLSGGRQPTVNAYDVLNRVISKSAGGVSTFTYDVGGRLRTANDSAARITRAYSPAGDLVADTLRVASAFLYEGNFEAHVYGMRSGYDLAGRRVWLKYPGTLVSADSVAYGFDATTGFLSAMRDPFGHSYTFGYDAEGSLTSLTRLAESASPVTEQRAYYADGTLRTRVQQAGTTTLHRDSLVYDRRGKVIANAITGDQATYSPLGQLTHTTYANAPGPENFLYDALGNKRWQDTFGATWPAHSDFAYEAGSGRLLRSNSPVGGGSGTDTTYYGYEPISGAVGDETHIHRWPVGATSAQEKRTTVNAFTADRRLASSRFQIDTIPTPTNPNYKVYSRIERYRYDALGRRVWRQMYRATSCPTHDATSGCRNETTRTVWDGDQMLFEVRALADSTSGSDDADQADGAMVGAVGYVHAGGIDEPLVLFKGGAVIAPLTNWRGQFDSGTCPTVLCASDTPEFPLAQASSYGDGPTTPYGPSSWFGDLIRGQTDGSGYQYRRNRYYDPRTGRFTQEDPIGLAGGLNAYGYAEGDPVTYSDPFGLCTIGKDCWQAFKRTVESVLSSPGFQMAVAHFGASMAAAEAAEAGGTTAADAVMSSEMIVEEQVQVAQQAAVRASASPDFVVTNKGTAVAIPDGATGPSAPERGTGMVYTGGTGGKGMDPRVSGVRIMDANNNQGRRVNYMNNGTQTVNPTSGRTISRTDPAGHVPLH